MNLKIYIRLAVLSLLCLSGRVEATSLNGKYHVLSNHSCGEYSSRYSAELAARNGPQWTPGGMITRDFIQIESYVAGWLTAYNALTEETNNIIPNGLDGALLWINNYCT